MKKLMMVSVVLVVMVFVTGLVVAEEEAVQLEPQTTCPVMGGKINQELFADYEGKRVYFCCPGCIGMFKADPEKYIEKLEAEGVTLEESPEPEKEKQNRGSHGKDEHRGSHGK
ncbi:MAG: YHS domain-containing protein [bacterium]|nr:YHS domain-containing protein [bacterium]